MFTPPPSQEDNQPQQYNEFWYQTGTHIRTEWSALPVEPATTQESEHLNVESQRVSPMHETLQPFTTLIASWCATTPQDTWLALEVRVRQNNHWTHWYHLPSWTSADNTPWRHSIAGQNDAMGGVATDIFQVKGATASAYQLRVTLYTLHPGISVHLQSIATVTSYDTEPDHIPAIPSRRIAWGQELAVPQRSQMLPEYSGPTYGGGGRVWCSPTSTSMVLAYWSARLQRPELQQTVPTVARGVYDPTYAGTGNWPFNTAYAAHFGGLHAYITRMYSLSQVEQWITAGIPVIISVSYEASMLPGAPMHGTDGHIIVVRGFTDTGDVIVNDPAASSDNEVRIIYERAALQRAWLAGSHGTCYLIYPENATIPIQDRYDCW